MIDLKLDLLEVAFDFPEMNEVLSSLGVPYSIVLLDEVIDKSGFFKPSC